MSSTAESRVSSRSAVTAYAIDTKRLHCPFTPGLHAEVEAIQAHAVGWAVALGLVVGEHAAVRLDASRVGWLVSRANPEARRELVEIAADWTTFFCLLDDKIERLPAPSAVGAYLDEIYAALTGGPCTRGDSLSGAAHDLSRRLHQIADKPWRTHFAARNRQLFEAFVLEAEVRAAGGFSELRDYLPMREVTVGIWVELALSELALGIELTTRERAETHQISRLACNLIGWANDIFTFEKERAAGDPNNLVLVLAKSLGGDLRSALGRAIQMHDREANELALHLAQIRLTGSDAAQRYAATLGYWVRGHLDWARETGRYDGCVGDPNGQLGGNSCASTCMRSVCPESGAVQPSVKSLSRASSSASTA